MRFKGNRQLFVVSVYMPATQRKPEHKTDQAALIECIERIYADFRSRSSAHLILLGDWNSVKTPATSRIRAGRFVQSWTPEREWWGKLSGTWALVDAASQKGHEHEVTFIRRGPNPHGAEEGGGDDDADDSDSEQDQQMDGPAVAEDAAALSAGRIDAVLHSAGLAPALLAVHPLPPEVALPHPSDHFPVMADYDLLKAELVRPPEGEARPAHPPPLFAPHLLEKEKLPAFRKAVEDRLQALENDLEKALGAAGTEHERRDRVSSLYRQATEAVLALAKEHKCLKARGSRPPTRRTVPWQLVMSKKVERLIAGWSVEAPGGLPSAPLVARIEKLEALIKGLVPGPEPMPAAPYATLTTRRRSRGAT
eukprot:tig00020801_g13890.t1